MLDFTILSVEQCNRLSIFDKIGSKAPSTNFARLLGCIGIWCTKTIETKETYDGDVIVIVAYSSIHSRPTTWFVDDYEFSTRPAILYSSISDYASNGHVNEEGIFEVEYGEYPQQVASDELQKKLDEAYSCDYPSIKSTGKTYTIHRKSARTIFNKDDLDEYNCETLTFEEFLYQDGKKYVKAKKITVAPLDFLDNYHNYYENNYYYKNVWVEVQPIKWLIDKYANIALTKNILFSGVPIIKLNKSYTRFSARKKYDGNFENTYMKEFLNTIFSKDIVPSNTNGLLDEIKKNVDEALKLLNKEPSNSDFGSPILDFKFLTNQHFWGKNKLSIFDKTGFDALMTDFSILGGAYYYNGKRAKDIRFGYIESESYGCYWGMDTERVFHQEPTSIGCVKDILNIDSCKRISDYYTSDRRYIGARPTISYSSISDYASNGHVNEEGIFEIEYGEYPQQVASDELQEQLNKEFEAGNLELSGKTYTTDSIELKNCSQKFKPQILEEYVINNKKYIRVKADLCEIYCRVYMFSNGKIYANGDYVWVEVQPIKWLVDEKENLAISKYILYAGVQFKYGRHYNGDFKRTDQKFFLDNFFSKEIVLKDSLKKIVSIEQTNENTQSEQKQKTDMNSFAEIDKTEELEDEDYERDDKVLVEDVDLIHELKRYGAEISTEIPVSDNAKEETFFLNSNMQSSISNININSNNIIRVIQEALANGKKVELHIIEENENQINKKEKQKIYTIK